jgi:ubiquinone/menaquinone biosynthesis C-methylase UbiE
MTTADSAFAGSIPALYDRYLGPLIFDPYAADLAARLADLGDGPLLEIAAGTGIVTRALARRLAGGIAIVATDLNQAMIDFAALQGSARPVTWQQADAQALPFADATFAAVACQFGVMFFPDKVAALAQAWRVLKPGGRLVFNVWDRLEDNEIPQVIHEAVASQFPDDPPGFLARAPYGHHDVAVIREQVRRAGFTDIAVETVSLRSRAPAARDPAIGFCQGSPLRNEVEARGKGAVAAATDAAEAAVAARFGPGAVEGGIRAHVMTARRQAG